MGIGERAAGFARGECPDFWDKMENFPPATGAGGQTYVDKKDMVVCCVLIIGSILNFLV